MRVVVAPDKFKGSLTARAAARAMSHGVSAAWPEAVVDEVPMADGGEGTVDALVASTSGRMHRTPVTGPLGEPVEAVFGVTGDGRTAILEMASASGLVLISSGQRDPMRATTRGTGELLLRSIQDGVSRVVLGIGGSATNDGGAGLAQALGYRLLDGDGRDLEPGGGPLGRLHAIDASDRDPRLDGVSIEVACDVDNPLCGPKGASAIYGPQKGATPELVSILDANLQRFAEIVKRDLGVAVAEVPGAGAAGGLGAGLIAFAGATLRRGVELVIEAVGLDERMAGADLCLTAEGAFDASSAHGKTPVGVAQVARRHGVPTLVLAGSVGEALLPEGVDAAFSILRGPMTLDEAMSAGGDLLQAATEQLVRAFLAGRRHGPDGLRP